MPEEAKARARIVDAIVDMLECWGIGREKIQKLVATARLPVLRLTRSSNTSEIAYERLVRMLMALGPDIECLMGLDEVSMRTHRNEVIKNIAETEKYLATLKQIQEVYEHLLPSPSLSVALVPKKIIEQSAPPPEGTKFYHYYMVMRDSKEPLHIKAILEKVVLRGITYQKEASLSDHLATADVTMRQLTKRYTQIKALGKRTYQWMD